MISVVIPTYNNRGGLIKTVNSVLKQVCSEGIEIIVVDDNAPNTPSRKQTEVLMQRYDNEPRVKYVKHPENKNGAAARNTGIKVSKGEFIAFLDDDDMFLPGKLQKQKDYLDAHPEYDAVYCLAERNGKPYGQDRSEGNCIRRMLLLETCIYTPCQMFRREALLEIKGFDESFRRHQDYDLLLRFFHAGYKIGCLTEILTEIGTNEGENIPSGKKLEEMKKYFFEKFTPYIDEIDRTEKGFKNRVFAKHYAGVFLRHMKSKNFKLALKILLTYYLYSPKQFSSVIFGSIRAHLS